MTYVLGINAYHGDVSTVLLRDGAGVAAGTEASGVDGAWRILPRC